MRSYLFPLNDITAKDGPVLNVQLLFLDNFELASKLKLKLYLALS